MNKTKTTDTKKEKINLFFTKISFDSLWLKLNYYYNSTDF